MNFEGIGRRDTQDPGETDFIYRGGPPTYFSDGLGYQRSLEILERGALRDSLLNPAKLRVALRLLRGVRRNGVNFNGRVHVRPLHAS